MLEEQIKTLKEKEFFLQNRMLESKEQIKNDKKELSNINKIRAQLEKLEEQLNNNTIKESE